MAKTGYPDVAPFLMAGKDAKYLVFAEYARVSKALSVGNRVELLQLLAQGERSVEALARR